MTQADSARRRVSGENVWVEVGQVWYDKRHRVRTVTITDVFECEVHDHRTDELLGVDRYVSVRRNTSRRTQAIKVDTLYAKYRRRGA